MLSPWTFINPWYYSQVYYIVMAVLTLFCIIQYSRYSDIRITNNNQSSTNVSAIVLIVIVILFIGLRPIGDVFFDMNNYIRGFENRQYRGYGFEFNWNKENVIFDNLYNYMAQNNFEIILFFLLISIIYFGCIYFAIKKIYPNDLFYALIIYLGALATFSYGTNGIKAGAAASIFLLAFAYYRKPIIAALFLWLSLGFHHSMSVVIAAFILSYLVRNPKWFFYGWLFCLAMAIFHVTAFQELFANFADESGSGYLLGKENEWGGRKGFRWDFILYVMPVVYIGWWTIYKHKLIDRLFQLLLCTFLTVNGIWMLCMYMPYNNRLAYLSWFILPIVCIYPFLKFKIQNNQYKLLNWVASIYISFSIYINCI